jgi:hypothetical protein
MYIITEIAIIGASTITAVAIMYLHSLAAFNYAPPKWLYTVLLIDCFCASNKDSGKISSEEDLIRYEECKYANTKQTHTGRR